MLNSNSVALLQLVLSLGFWYPRMAIVATIALLAQPIDISNNQYQQASPFGDKKQISWDNPKSLEVSGVIPISVFGITNTLLAGT